MKVLVVGGTGFIGAAIAEALDRAGAEVLVLSRSGEAPVGVGLAGDVRRPNLGLGSSAAQATDGLTHVVSCFGSVSWSSGPRVAKEVHALGTRNVLNFCAAVEDLERLVHVSSVLALGRAEGTLGNRELDVGQTHRNWYEYGKFLAEGEVRRCETVPWRIVRLGPVVGASEDRVPDMHTGMLALVPLLLRGFPVHIDDRGDYPCYISEVGTAAEIVTRACGEADFPQICTWFDPERITTAQALNGICAAWGVVPRIVDAPPLRTLARLLSHRLGASSDLVEYAEAWARIDPRVLDEIPAPLPVSPESYLEHTGEALRRHSSRIRI